MKMPPPTSEEDLLLRAGALAGKKIVDLAALCQQVLPKTLHFSKGFMGLLLETLLGAYAGSKAEPDFVDLGIELKTLPITASGRPVESTYITILPLMRGVSQSFETSEVYAKLRRVLWIPIVSERHMPIGERYIANPFLWSPSEEDFSILKSDWEEIMDMVMMGEVHQLTGRFGEYLHVRPKGGSSSDLTAAYAEDGQLIQTLPRGFYLRTTFTKKILSAELKDQSMLLI
jgi:DNA mismatch repair protein MutH